MSSDPVDQLGALANEHLTNPVNYQNFLLHLLLDGNKAHCWAGDCLADCFSISSIILVRFDIWFDVLRRQEANIAAHITQQPRPEMRTWTCLKPQQAWSKCAEEAFDLFPFEFTTDHRPTELSAA